TPAVEDHLVARFPIGMRGALDGASKIDARDHRPSPHHRRLSGQSKAVLIVDGRPFDADGDVAVHEVGLVEIGQRNPLAAVCLLDHDRLECRHTLLPQPETDDLCRGFLRCLAAPVSPLLSSESDSEWYPSFQALASRRESSWTLPMRTQASALAIVASKSLARRRLRPSQAKVRSTTQRRGSGLNVPTVCDRVTIWIVHLPKSASALSSFGPR